MSNAIEVRNVSTFEPDVGLGKLLKRGETAEVPDTQDNRALIEDGVLRETTVAVEPPPDEKPADQQAAKKRGKNAPPIDPDPAEKAPDDAPDEGAATETPGSGEQGDSA